MLYPSFYFDVFEDVMNSKIDDKELIKVIDLKCIYQKIIKKIYYFISNITDIPKIEWIKYL